MTTKRFTVILPRDWIAWWLPLAVVTVLCTIGFIYGQDPPPLFKATCIAVPVISWAIFALRTWLRWRFKKSIVIYTGFHNVGIGLRFTGPRVGMSTQLVDEAAEQAVDFWARSYGMPYATFRDVIDGTILTFADSITYKWNGPVRQVEGIQLGKSIVVKWAAGDTLEQVESRVRHELSHIILDYMGVEPGPGGEGHHVEFRRHGFKDVG